MHCHRAQRVDLLGDFHRAYLRSHRGSHSSREHQTGDGRTKLTKHRDRYQGPGRGLEAEDFKLKIGLRGQHGTSESSRDNDHYLRASADLRNLLHQLAIAPLSADNGDENFPNEQTELAEVIDQSQKRPPYDAEKIHWRRQ